MTALYVLAQEHRALAERLADMDLDEQTIADTLDGESGALQEKATAVAMVCRNLEAQAEAIKAAEKQMADRRKAAEGRADRLRDYLLRSLLAAGIKRVEHPMLSVAVKGKAAALEVFDEAQIPDIFFNQPPPPDKVLDKKAVLDAIRAGADVPGARLSCNVHRLEIK